MTVFLNTNIVLDWLLDREDTYAQETTDLFVAAEEGRIAICVAAGSIYTVAYVLHRAGKRGQALRTALSSFLALVDVAIADKITFVKTSQLTDISDLEDAFQYRTALNNPLIQYMVTGNIKDFRLTDQSRLPAVTPTEMVKLLSA